MIMKEKVIFSEYVTYSYI